MDGLYDRLIVDPKVMKYFKGVEMKVLKEHQFHFMRIAFTGVPKDMDVGAYLRDGHSRLWDMVCW